MQKFAIFFTYSPEAWKAMTENPQDRSIAVKQLVEGVGGKLECFYWMSGAFDGFSVIELPDGQSAGAFAAIVKATGSLQHYETHMLTSMNDAVAMLKKAQAATKSYRPPGR